MIAGASYGRLGKVFLLRCITHKRFPHKRFGFLLFFSFILLLFESGLDHSSYATRGHIWTKFEFCSFMAFGNAPAHFFNHWSSLQSGNLMWRWMEKRENDLLSWCFWMMTQSFSYSCTQQQQLRLLDWEAFLGMHTDRKEYMMSYRRHKTITFHTYSNTEYWLFREHLVVACCRQGTGYIHVR